MQLTPEQIREFYDRGYVKIPGAISKAMVDTARQAVNHSIGTLGPNGEDMSKHRAGAILPRLEWCPGYQWTCSTPARSSPSPNRSWERATCKNPSEARKSPRDFPQ